jgi:hypothetical protein
VKNIGFDSGTHGSRTLRWTLSRQAISGRRVTFPRAIQIIDDDYVMVQKAIFRQMGGQVGSFVRRVKRSFDFGAW